MTLPRKDSRSYSRHGLNALKARVTLRGLSALDARSSAVRALLGWREQMIADMNGKENCSAAQLALIELACRTRLYIEHVDAWIVEQPTLINKRKRALLPVVKERQGLVDSLAKILGQLGLERRAKPVMELSEYLLQRAEAKSKAESSTDDEQREPGPVDAGAQAQMSKPDSQLTILETLEDPKLFGGLFSTRSLRSLGRHTAESWQPWKIALAALFGLAEPDPAGLALYRQSTHREVWPSAPAKEAWFIVGRRGGKSRIAALCAVFLAAFRDYSELLAAGELATILVIATDRDQTRVVLGYVKALLAAVDMLKRMIVSDKAESIELTNRTRIEVATCSFRAPRGYTLAGVVCDEAAYWRSEDSAQPDVEVLNAVRPGMATVPGSLLLAIGSPYARRGAMYATHSKHFGKDSRVLVWQAPSMVMNPTLPAEVVEEALAADPESARAEYLAEFRSDLESFVNVEALKDCVETGCYERAPVPGLRYHAFVDPSGGSVDSMTLAVAHVEGQRVMLDLVREVKSPFSPASVTLEFAATMKTYRVATAEADRYGCEWVREPFSTAVIDLQASDESKSELYLRVLPAINSGQVVLLDHPRMLRQFESLERRTGRGTGRDSVDHPSGLHDDVANAAAGALCLALRELGGGGGWPVTAASNWIKAGRPQVSDLALTGGETVQTSAEVAQAAWQAQINEAVQRPPSGAAVDLMFGDRVFGANVGTIPGGHVAKPSTDFCPKCGKGMSGTREYKRCICGYEERKESSNRG